MPRLLPALLLCCIAPLFAAAQPRPADALLETAVLQRMVAAQTARAGHALRPLLRHPDAAVRARAAFALASVQDTTALADLRARLRDTDPGVRADAAFALGQTPHSPAEIQPTVQALLQGWAATQDVRARRQILDALGKQGDAGALADLTALEVSDALGADWALAVARFGLRDLHHAGAVRRLATALTHSDPYTRQRAAYYFGRVPDPAPWQHLADTVRAALDGYTPADAAAMHLVLGLGRLQDPADTPRLLRWLAQATDWRIRTHAAAALADRAAWPDVQPPLRAALSDSIHHVALRAAASLAAADSLLDETVDALEAEVVQHPDAWRINHVLLPILARHNRTEAVFDWLDRSPAPTDPFAAAAGVEALAEVPGPAGLTRLLEATEAPQAMVAYAAVSALHTRWQEVRLNNPPTQLYYAAFVRALHRHDVALAYAAVPALADSLFWPLGASAELQTAYQKMETPAFVEAMVETLRALARLGDTDAVPLVRTAVRHPDPLVHRAAAEALEALTGEHPASPPVERTAPFIDWDALAAWGASPTWVLETEGGDIEIEVDVAAAPLTAQTLLRLTEAGDLNGVPFHRVVPNFVAQGGDYSRRDGFGGPPFVIRSEFTQIAYARGTVGMASLGKDTEGSQFFIAHSMQPHLDGRYTAFGRVVSGMAVADRLARGDRIVRAYVR